MPFPGSLSLQHRSLGFRTSVPMGRIHAGSQWARERGAAIQSSLGAQDGRARQREGLEGPRAAVAPVLSGLGRAGWIMMPGGSRQAGVTGEEVGEAHPLPAETAKD